MTSKISLLRKASTIRLFVMLIWIAPVLERRKILDSRGDSCPMVVAYGPIVPQGWKNVNNRPWTLFPKNLQKISRFFLTIVKGLVKISSSGIRTKDLSKKHI